MPTPEQHATDIVQIGGLLTSLLAFVFSPVTWAGFLGAAFGVAFSEPKDYKEGLLWLAFGIAVSLLFNSWLVNVIGNYASAISFGLAFLVVKFHKLIFDKIGQIIDRKGNGL